MPPITPSLSLTSAFLCPPQISPSLAPSVSHSLSLTSHRQRQQDGVAKGGGRVLALGSVNHCCCRDCPCVPGGVFAAAVRGLQNPQIGAQEAEDAVTARIKALWKPGGHRCLRYKAIHVNDARIGSVFDLADPACFASWASHHQHKPPPPPPPPQLHDIHGTTTRVVSSCLFACMISFNCAPPPAFLLFLPCRCHRPPALPPPPFPPLLPFSSLFRSLLLPLLLFPPVELCVQIAVSKTAPCFRLLFFSLIPAALLCC